MNEAQLYEKIGRLQSAVDDRAAAYDRLLEVFANVVTGEIDSSRVIVDLTNRTWAYSEVGTRPGMPSQINGVPVCVMAPESPQETQVGPFCDKDGEVFVCGKEIKIVRVLGPAEPRPE